ncbi:unnamed protein product [Chironomus riparius]|uniref:Uncharacterized protein n=1 Tax=Chironomus riparius TaxID=315576 RepID=A0A9N9S802_9DIPT|nr:unnamed protein product [Chironomus riparius]
MIRLIFLIIVVNFSSQLQIPRSVTVQEVKLQCQREVTSKIVCTLPSNAGQNSILEIIKAFSYVKRDLTDYEVKQATEVDISDRFMSIHMPFEIGKNFPKLEALWVVKSKIKFIKKDNFAKMVDLKALNLYENQIEEIPVDTFTDLPNLEFLDIDNNKIMDLHADLLIYQTNLLVFRASDNKISTIPDGFFRSNTKLERIHLSHNQIKEVHVDFTKFSDLVIVDLEGNKNGCDFSVGYYEDWKLLDVDGSRNETDEFAWLQFQVERKCRLGEDDNEY